MARTLQTIYNEIITEKETYTTLSTLTPINTTYQSLLTDLTSASKVAIWRLWVYLIALAIWFHEQVFDAHKVEVNAIVEDNQLGQTRWYVTKALGFQNGYTLIWDGTKYIYNVVDEDSQIVAQASALDTGSAVLIKVAKYTDPSNPETSDLEPLATAEETSLETYINTIKPAGIQSQIINIAPDDLKASVNIVYDALLLTDQGELIQDSTETDLTQGDKPAEIAFDNFVKGLPFDGKFRAVDLVDAIQLAEGVTNVVLTLLQARSGTNPYTDILNLYNQEYTVNAGYFSPDNSAEYIISFTYYNS